MEIRSLQGVSFEALAVAFNDAFSDYAVPADYSTGYLKNLLIRRGYRPDLAVGSFDGNRLVGFVFNALDGESAYNSGTGVVITHRRRGIARALMQRSIETLPAHSYVLEVIETNERAAALYRQLGFEETRRLQSWSYARAPHPAFGHPLPAPRGEGKRKPLSPREIHPRSPSPRVRGEGPRSGGEGLDLIREWCDVAPAWQNETHSLRRAAEPYVVLGDENGGVIVFPSNGDVAQLAVRKESRRKGVGRALLEAAAAQTAAPLRIINIDDRDAGIAAFLERCGARKSVRQIEMIRTL